MRMVLILPVLLASLAGCVTAVSVATARLSDMPVVDGGSYSSGGGLTIAAEAREQDGRTMVCGVWAKSRQQSALTALAEFQVIGSGSVLLGRERVVSNLSFMRQVDPAPSYGRQEAGCVVTKRAWRAGDERRPVAIRIPRQVVAREQGSPFFGGGFAVWFEQTGPGAGTR